MERPKSTAALASSAGSIYRLIGGRFRGPKDTDRFAATADDWGKSLYRKDFDEKAGLGTEENWIKNRSKTRPKLRATAFGQSESRTAFSDANPRASSHSKSWVLDRERKKYVPLQWAVPLKSEAGAQYRRSATQEPVYLHTASSRLRCLEENGYEPRDLTCGGESTYRREYVEKDISKARPHQSSMWPVSQPPPPPPPGEFRIAPAPTNPARRRMPSAFDQGQAKKK
jgi:hypothetical protein